MNPYFDFNLLINHPGARERLVTLGWSGEDEAAATDLILDDADNVLMLLCDTTFSRCDIYEWLGLYLWKADFSDGVEGPYASLSELRDIQSFHLQAELLADGDRESILGLEYSVWSSLDEIWDIAAKLIFPGMKIKVNNTLYILTDSGLEECID
jgi:hypothetical protein